MANVKNIWANWDDAKSDEENIAAGALLDAEKMINIEDRIDVAQETEATPGPKGDPGEAATVTAGIAQYGEALAVTNSGTTSAAIFDFTFVEPTNGSDGAKGDTGEKGDPGEAGAHITSIALTLTETDGAVTGGSGTATLSDETTAPITITVTTA